MSTARVPVETLLAHREWVRCVARAVVRDPNAADDVEQETWLAALRSPPRTASSLRGWFGAVTRSRARRIGRTDARRDARESASARPEATPSAADLAEMADTHRRVVAAVVALDEPYRETILLRYFEGLAIGDVAVRSAVPLETARSRLKRGVARLRERLAEELGEDDRPWQAALAPLAARPHGAALAAGGGLVVASTTTTAAAVAAMLLLIGGGAVVAANWGSDDGVPVAPVPAAQTAAPPYVAAAPEKPAAPSRQPRQRAAEAAPAPAPPPEPKPAQTALQKLDGATMAPHWNQAPLPEVFAEIAAAADVEIVLSKEVADRLDKSTAIESLRLDKPISARQVLGLVTQLKGLRWGIEEPRVVIAPADGNHDASLPFVALPPWTRPGPIDVLGRVTDANGGYVAGAEIVQSQRGVRTVATTDPGGHYDAHLEWPYGSLEARIAGQIRSFTATVSGKPGSKVTLDFALRGAAGSLSVRVVGDAGPLKDVEVRLVPDLPRPKTDAEALRWQDEITARTAEDGTVVFPSVEPGMVAVYASLAGYDEGRGGVKVDVGGRAELRVQLVPKVGLSAKLDTSRISFNFQGARFTEVVRFINDAKSLSVVVDPAIAPRLQDADITLELRDVPVRTALRSLCDAVGGVTFDVHEKEEIVWIHADKR